METRDAPKLRNVQRLDSIQLDINDATYFTKEGYLVDHPILTSVGIFEYVNPDGSIRKELRLPEHVFKEESLKSYKGKPIIITHRAGKISNSNVKGEMIGTIMSEGYADGEDVKAEIIIHDTDSMKSSGFKELSLGYNLTLIEQPGEWNGEHYDAIQTNIVINHLALVPSARAGEQARLNIDSKDTEILKGGKKTMAKPNERTLSPEDLQIAIDMIKKSLNMDAADKKEEDKTAEDPAKAFDESEKPAEETKAVVKEDSKDEKAGKTPEDIAQFVKDRRDRRDGEEDTKMVISQQDEDIDMLLAALEKLIADAKVNTDGEEEKKDSEAEDCGNKDEEDIKKDSDEEEKPEVKEEPKNEEEPKAMNADSADEIFRQRLSLCRAGDKLNMDGLENMSIVDGKKAIIGKVLPDMRLDGKSNAYLDAMFDLAVNELNKPKTVTDQRKEMSANQGTVTRLDGSNETMAQRARRKMIEGGN